MGEVGRVKPTLCLVYLNAEVVARRVLAAADRVAPRPVLLDCSQLSYIDYAATQVRYFYYTHYPMQYTRGSQSMHRVAVPLCILKCSRIQYVLGN